MPGEKASSYFNTFLSPQRLLAQKPGSLHYVAFTETHLTSSFFLLSTSHPLATPTCVWERRMLVWGPPGSAAFLQMTQDTHWAHISQLTLHLPFIHSFIQPLVTWSANMGSVMLLGAVGASKKHNTLSCYQLFEATHIQPQYKTEGSKL